MVSLNSLLLENIASAYDVSFKHNVFVIVFVYVFVSVFVIVIAHVILFMTMYNVWVLRCFWGDFKASDWKFEVMIDDEVTDK